MNGSFDSDTELFEKSFDEYICDSDDEIIVFENAQKSKCSDPTTLMVNDVLLDRENLDTGRSYVRFLKMEQETLLRTHKDAIEFGWDI